MAKLRVGIVAPCSVVPQVEFAAGVERIRAEGFGVRVHEQVAQQHFTFAGTDEARADAFFAFASDPEVDVVWSARGGYGASRLLDRLDRLSAERGKPRAGKLLVGYSDITVLHEYVRQNWGWHTLHAPMPSAVNFTRLGEREWQNTVKLVRGEKVEFPAGEEPLKALANGVPGGLQAELVGGNLSLWAALAGTRHAPTPARSRILFLEDVDEAFYRLDRMMTQLRSAGLLDGAAAIVLGDFTNCADDPGTCLAPVAAGDELAKALADPRAAKRNPLRKTFSYEEGLEHVFGSLARELAIPLYHGLKVGHGPHFHPLPLGARYELSASGQLRLLDWSWLRR